MFNRFKCSLEKLQKYKILIFPTRETAKFHYFFTFFQQDIKSIELYPTTQIFYVILHSEQKNHCTVKLVETILIYTVK